MKFTVALGWLCALVFLVAGCVSVRSTKRSTFVASGGGMSVADALAAEKIETTMDANGGHLETEYHMRPDDVPEAVHKAMEAKHPGGTYIGAEKEYNDGQLFYELAKEIDGFEVEAMFYPDGRPYDSEIQVAPESVPQSVQDAIKAGWPDGSVNAWEEIRDGAGVLQEYHVKLEDGGKAYKVLVSPDGKLKGAYREIPAEIEVPVALPK